MANDKIKKPKDKANKPNDKIKKPKEKGEKTKEKGEKTKEKTDKPKEKETKPKNAPNKKTKSGQEKLFIKLFHEDMDGKKLIPLANKLGKEKCKQLVESHTIKYCKKNKLSNSVMENMLTSNKHTLDILLKIV